MTKILLEANDNNVSASITPNLAEVHVLVLDLGYVPVKVISWMRAMTLIQLGRASAVEFIPGLFVHSGRGIAYPVPWVVSLTKIARQGKSFRNIKCSRKKIWERDGQRCAYCLKSLQYKDSTLDHLMPVSRGGRTDWTNMVCSCIKCNQYKGDRTPEEANMPLQVKPRVPTLSDLLRSAPSTPEPWRVFLVGKK